MQGHSQWHGRHRSMSARRLRIKWMRKQRNITAPVRDVGKGKGKSIRLPRKGSRAEGGQQFEVQIICIGKQYKYISSQYGINLK